MRTCFSCNGEGEKVFCEDEPAEVCDLCEGKGYIEDGCYCAAREPFECGCGGYDDIDLDEWYDDIFPKAKTRTEMIAEDNFEIAEKGEEW